jgi:DNA-binding transcriptional ArsR family regulator
MRPTSQSFLRHPFSTVFAHGSDVRVLRELVKHGGELPVSALLDRTKLTRPSVLATLDRLTDLGYVEALGAAHRLYRIDHGHPLAPAISALFAAEEQRFRNIIDCLRNAAADAGAVAAWLYGSVSRGLDGPYSDIDAVFVDGLGDIESMKAKLREALREPQDRLRFTASIIVLNASDIIRLAENNDPWWRTMIQDATPLAGPDPAATIARLRVPP